MCCIKGPFIVPFDPGGHLAGAWRRKEGGSSLRMLLPSTLNAAAGMTGGNTGACGSHHHCPSGQTVALCARPDGGHPDTCPLLRGHTDTKGGHRWTLEGKHRGHRSHTIIQKTGREEVAQGPGGEKRGHASKCRRCMFFNLSPQSNQILT